MDVARAIVLGASAGGIARPALKALTSGGRSGALAFLEGVEAELRAVMLLTGSRNIAALRKAKKVVGGELRIWLDQA
jgi:isopentenyl-diphosphate Delta-isomerase